MNHNQQFQLTCNPLTLFGDYVKKASFFLLTLFLSVSVFAQYTTTGNGSAAGAVCDGDCFELTPDANWQSGAVWSQTQLNLAEGFSICFNANFGNNDAGADGITFVLHNDPNGTSALAANGGFLGLGGTGAIQPSLAVEFDTYWNSALGDNITADHIAIVQNGDLTNPTELIQADLNNANIEDGDCHNICINWDPKTSTLRVSFDGENRVTTTIDPTNDVFGGNSNVFWGFTAGTGSARNRQVVCIENVDTYANCCNTDCPELIVNGDFDDDCLGFTGDLMVNPCGGALTGRGQSTLGTQASDFNTAWNRTDPSGTGNFMIIDAAVADQVVWRSNISVRPGQVYCFEALVSNICENCGNEPSFELRTGGLAGTLVASINNVDYDDGWVSLCGTITATECNDNLEVNVVMLGGGSSSAGNDGGLDNVSISSTQCEVEECCDNFSFLVDVGCTGFADAVFTGDPAICNFPHVVLEGFNCGYPIANGQHGTYSLSPGEVRQLRAYLIDTCGDTLCVKEAFVSCPISPVCCDGFLLESYSSVTFPGQYDLYLWQNAFIPCPVYSVRLNGAITVSGGGFPIVFPAPCMSSGIYIGSVNPAFGPSYTVDYLDAFGSVICSQSASVGGVPKMAPFSGSTEYDAVFAELTMELIPNPANSDVTVSFSLPFSSSVTVEIMDVNGRTVLLQQSNGFEAGEQRMGISTADIPSGFYLIRLSDGTNELTKPLAIQH